MSLIGERKIQLYQLKYLMYKIIENYFMFGFTLRHK